MVPASLSGGPWLRASSPAGPLAAGPLAGPLAASLTSVCVGLVEQLAAGVQVSEGSDAQAVGGVELALQELTAHLSDVHELEQAGGR